MDKIIKHFCATFHESSVLSLEVGYRCRLIFPHIDLDHVLGSYLRNLYELCHFLHVAYALVLTMSKSFVMLF